MIWRLAEFLAVVKQWPAIKGFRNNLVSRVSLLPAEQSLLAGRRETLGTRLLLEYLDKESNFVMRAQ